MKVKGQVFTKCVPASRLWSFLNAIQAEESDRYVIVTNADYKRSQLLQLLTPFLAEIETYYLPSKRHFIAKKISYHNLLTILRQICNANGIQYERKMKYDKSSYEIEYYIQKTSEIMQDVVLLP